MSEYILNFEQLSSQDVAAVGGKKPSSSGS